MPSGAAKDAMARGNSMLALAVLRLCGATDWETIDNTVNVKRTIPNPENTMAAPNNGRIFSATAIEAMLNPQSATRAAAIASRFRR